MGLEAALASRFTLLSRVGEEGKTGVETRVVWYPCSAWSCRAVWGFGPAEGGVAGDEAGS